MKMLLAAIGLCTLGAPLAGASVVARQLQRTNTGDLAGGKDIAAVGVKRQPAFPGLRSEDTLFLRRRPALPHNDETKDPEQVQHEVERMMTRVEKIGDPALTDRYVVELAHVEADLAERTRAGATNAALRHEIASVRAKLCDEQGFAHHETQDCERFMNQGCEISGSWKTKQAKARANAPVTDAQCQHFFLVGARDEPTVFDTASNPNVSVPVPEEGLFGGKQLRPLPVHGYNEYGEGKLVEHTNETAIGDWQKEFGSYSGGRNVQAICRDFPDNQWCRLHVRRRKRHKSRASHHHGCFVASAVVFMSVAVETFRAAIV
jgi:hypothetical protein